MLPFRILLLWPPLLLALEERPPPLLTGNETEGVSDEAGELWPASFDGSGMEGSGLADEEPPLVSSSSSTSAPPRPSALKEDSGAERKSFLSAVEKRAAISKSTTGNFPTTLLDLFTPKTLVIPGDALRALGRTLNKATAGTRDEYVALYIVNATSRYWGKAFLDDNRTWRVDFATPQGYLDVHKNNLNVRIVRLPSDASTAYGFDVEWVRARDVDPLLLLVQTDTRKYYRKLTAAVWSEDGFEVLGMADIEEGRFFYSRSSHNQYHVEQVTGASFLNNVYVLTKKSCACTCSAPSAVSSSTSSSGGFFSSIRNFFG